jgi:hypothetical protein
MKSRDNAKLNMYQSVLKVCEANPTVYVGVKAFADGVVALRTGITNIREVNEMKKNVSVVGVTQNKQVTADILIEKALTVVNATYAYAFADRNTELTKQSSLTKSDFYRARGNELLSMAKNIYKNAQGHIASLADYGITAETLEQLSAAIADFEAILTKPRETTVERKVHTDTLPQLFATVNSILYDRLDKLIVLFRTSAPDFYAAYKSARNVIDTSTRSKTEAAQ